MRSNMSVRVDTTAHFSSYSSIIILSLCSDYHYIITLIILSIEA